MVLHTVKQNAAYSPWRITKILHSNERTEGITDEHVLDGDQLSRRAHRCLAECRKCRVTTSVSPGKWARAHVVQFDLVVIRRQYVFEIGGEPGLSVFAEYSRRLVSISHTCIVGSTDHRFITVGAGHSLSRDLSSHP